MVYDWAGDELREEQYEQGIVVELVFLAFPPGDVYEIGDLLESEEGNRQWQGNFGDGYQPVAQAVQPLKEKVGVLEIPTDCLDPSIIVAQPETNKIIKNDNMTIKCFIILIIE